MLIPSVAPLKLAAAVSSGVFLRPMRLSNLIAAKSVSFRESKTLARCHRVTHKVP